MKNINIPKWLLLLIPIILIKPLWEFIQRLNYELFSVFRNGIGFFEANPLITILAGIIAYLLFTRSH